MQQLLACLLVVVGCGPIVAQVRPIASPAGEKSGEPNLTATPAGDVVLSWIEPTATGHSLQFAVRKEDRWSESKQIAAGDDWFVNWADFPSVVVLPDGRMAAHWLVKSAKGTYDYDVHIALSADAGKTWSKSLVPHRDGAKAEHGFVSLLPRPDNRLSVFWLDGRAMKPKRAGQPRGAMTLRYVEIDEGGELHNGALLDARVCECCQTSAAMAAAGPVVVFRDRSAQEIRDISIVRRVDGKWTKPRAVCRDDWLMPGCPVNGPSVAAVGDQVVVGWFTGADGKGRVKLAQSFDGGETFGEPILIDRGAPVGRVEIVALPDGTTWVCWLTRLEKGAAVLARRVAKDGSLGKALTVARTGSARANGFPQLVRSGDELVFAWTSGRVQCATMPLR